MADYDDDRGDLYIVLVNDEGQYSLWPARNGVPAGWRSAGMNGSKAACLEYVDDVWLDITPLALQGGPMRVH